jgi:hypothetical protein
MNQQTEPRPAGGAARGAQEVNARFFLIVGVLLVMIIALLAGLWLRERVRATTAEYELRQITRQHRMLEAVVRQMILLEQMPTTQTTTAPATQRGPDPSGD